MRKAKQPKELYDYELPLGSERKIKAVAKSIKYKEALLTKQQSDEIREKTLAEEGANDYFIFNGKQIFITPNGKIFA